jgi:outer membrane protein assembly factor BamB
MTHDDLLLVQFDDAIGGRLLALRSASGEIAWKAERDVQPSWASPVLVRRAGGPEVVLNANPFVAAYDARTGMERWRLDCMDGEVAVSVAWWNGTVFAGNEYAQLVAIRTAKGPQIAWRTDEDLPEVSSPVAWSNCLFTANGRGTVTCLDTESGRLHWKHEFDEGFYASPVVAADRLYLTDMSGVTHVLAAGPEFAALGKGRLGERCTCTPAFVGRRIYIRGETFLYCLEGQ